MDSLESKVMVILARRDMRDALFLPASHDGPLEFRAQKADMHEDAPASQGLSEKMAPEGPRVSFEVRRARLTDILSLSRVSPRFEMNQPNSSRSDIDPVRASVRRLLPFARDDRRIFVAVAKEGQQLLGFAQFHVVGPDQRWVLESIGTNVGIYESSPVVAELLRHALVDAGLSGVKRLYAHSEPTCPIYQSLREMGFEPFTQETVMGANAVPVKSTGRGVRVQDQADVWAIHQLYIHSTPRQVQYAEALTSHSWDVDAIVRNGADGCQGWMIADDYIAIAYARAISRRDAHVLDFMVVPQHRNVLPDLLATVFRDLSGVSSRRTFVIVRRYQSEYLPILEQQGFVPALEQEVLVKYTTASVRSTMLASGVVAVDPQKETSARRVPTFFHGPGDL